MYKLKRGWTKESVMALVTLHNDDTRALSDSGGWDGAGDCVYLNEVEGNRCPIGAFIPDAHEALHFNGSVTELMEEYPELAAYMPFEDIEALQALQNAHDKMLNKYGSVHEVIQDFLDKLVE